MSFWSPQPGPQVDAATCPADVVLYGGARGGGKSDCTLGRQLRGAEKYGLDWNGLVLRRKFKDLAELRRRIDSFIAMGLPAERVGGDNQTNAWKFANGARVTLTAILRLEQVDSFQGQQFTEISIEEATNFPFLPAMLDKLRGCLRSPAGVPCRMFLTGNPGGPGHNDVKLMFISSGPPHSIMRDPESGETRVFIPAKVTDNAVLVENDPQYVQRLMSIKDPALRRAWLDGDWDVFLGQAFEFSPTYHVVKPMPIPEHAPMYMTFDWGYGAPFSVGWWWTDRVGRLIRCGEWYGWAGMAGAGLRLTDSEIAQGIIERERTMGLTGRQIIRLAGPDCFQKKPNYLTGGQGPGTAEKFAAYGLYLIPGDPTRHAKIRQFRERLHVEHTDPTAPDYEPPQLIVYSTCEHFIRTIPALCVDDDNPEDIDTDQEDHVYDEACHAVMARPLALKDPETPKTSHDRRIEALLRPVVDETQKWADYAAAVQAESDRDFGIDRDSDVYGEVISVDDSGGLVSTM